MAMLIIVLLSAVAAVAGLAAAISDARRRTWRMALYGVGAFIVAAIVLIALLKMTADGSVWHSAILWPMAAAFGAIYLTTRLVMVMRGT